MAHPADGTIAADGHGGFTFTPATGHSGTNIPLTFTATDGTASVQGQATMDVDPATHAAVISGADTGAVTEDLDPNTLVTWIHELAASDPNGTSPFFTQTGGYTTSNSTVLHWLNNGDIDEYGDASTANVGVSHSSYSRDKIDGSFATKNLITEGKLNVTDAGEDHFTAQSGVEAHGHFAIDEVGNWLYTADNANPDIQALNTGQTLTETITVHSADGTSHDLTIAIHGTDENVPPTISLATPVDLGNVTVGQSLQIDTAALLAIVTDTDTAASGLSISAVALTDPTAGTIASDDHGGFTFTRAAGHSGQDIDLAFTATDGTNSVVGHVQVDVDPANHAAVISGVDTGDVTEDQNITSNSVSHDGELKTSGVLTVADLDPGEDHFKGSVVNGKYGWFAMGSNGHWVYTADNDHQDIQQLNTGQSLTESITVHSADGTAHDITFTIHGTDEISPAPPPDHNQSDEGDMSEQNPRITVEVESVHDLLTTAAVADQEAPGHHAALDYYMQVVPSVDHDGVDNSATEHYAPGAMDEYAQAVGGTAQDLHQPNLDHDSLAMDPTLSEHQIPDHEGAPVSQDIDQPDDFYGDDHAATPVDEQTDVPIIPDPDPV